jgi:hypothetical protein
MCRVVSLIARTRLLTSRGLSPSAARREFRAPVSSEHDHARTSARGGAAALTLPMAARWEQGGGAQAPPSRRDGAARAADACVARRRRPKARKAAAIVARWRWSQWPVQSEIARQVRSEPFVPFTYFNACGRRGARATNRQRLVQAAVRDWRARLEAEADTEE